MQTLGEYASRAKRSRISVRGLIISHHEVYGWTITEPSMELIEYIIDKGWGEINISRGYGWTPPPSTGTKAGDGSTSGTTGTTTGPKKSSTRKLQCPCCGNSVRATKAVRIMCMDCMEQMMEV